MAAAVQATAARARRTSQSSDSSHGLTRPPRSENRRSQIYLPQSDDDVSIASAEPAPTLLPAFGSSRANEPARSSSNFNLRRTAAARRDLADATADRNRLRTDALAAQGASTMLKQPSTGADTISSFESGSWSDARTRTPTGSSIDSHDSTPRGFSGPARATQERAGSITNIGGTLHQPPVLLARGTPLAAHYASTEMPRAGSSASLRLNDDYGSGDYSGDEEVLGLDDGDNSSDSHGWSGVEDNYGTSPMKSPLLSQVLGNTTPSQTFGATFLGGSSNYESMSGARSSSTDRASLSSDANLQSHRRGTSEGEKSSPGTPGTPMQGTWWKSETADADQTVRIASSMASGSKQPVRKQSSSEGRSDADRHASDPTSPSQVGKALPWDEKAALRPATPLLSSYTPSRPSLGTPPSNPASPHRDAFRSSSRDTQDDSPSGRPMTPPPQRQEPLAIPSRQSPSRTSSSNSASSQSLEVGRSSTSPLPPVPPRSPRPRTVQPAPVPSTTLSTSSPGPSQPSTSVSRPTPVSVTDSPAAPSPPRRNRGNLPPPPEKSAKRVSRMVSRQIDAATLAAIGIIPANSESTPSTSSLLPAPVLAPGDAPSAPPVVAFSPEHHRAPVEDLEPPRPRGAETADLPRPTSTADLPHSHSDYASILSENSSMTAPNTPLSASDFVDTYGGREFGRSGSVGSSLISGSRPSSAYTRAGPNCESRLSMMDLDGMSTIPDEDRADDYESSALARSDSMRMMANLSVQLSDAMAGLSTKESAEAEAALTADVGRSRHAREPSEIQATREDGNSVTPAPPLRPALVVDVQPSTVPPSRSATTTPFQVDSDPPPPPESPRSRADAKARAAAFVADLKRARAAAGASVMTTSTDDSATQTFTSPMSNFPDSPQVADTAPRIEAVAAASTPLLEQPSQQSLESPPRASPVLPSLPPRPQATSALSHSPLLSKSPQSSSPGPASVGAPSQSQDKSTLTPEEIAFARRISEGALPALPPPSPAADRLARLHRRRPLPPALQIVPDLRRCQAAGDRAEVYAMKINALRRETNGLADWISAVRTGVVLGGANPSPSSPGRSRRDASAASFPSRGDGYRAKELTGTFATRDLSPSNVPFPGVLNPFAPPGRYQGPKSPPNALHNNAKSSFFSGLGRRGSKRVVGPISQPILTPPPSQSRGPLNISSPIGIPTASSSMSLSALASVTASPSSNNNGSRPLGPRMPGTAARASIDSAMNTYAQLPSSSSSSNFPQSATAAGALPLASRSSFSYGSSSGSSLIGLPSSSTQAAYAFHHQHQQHQQQHQQQQQRGALGSDDVSASVSVSAAEDQNDKVLERLENILPTAERDALKRALNKARGDEVLAVSVYLSDEAAATAAATAAGTGTGMGGRRGAGR